MLLQKATSINHSHSFSNIVFIGVHAKSIYSSSTLLLLIIFFYSSKIATTATAMLAFADVIKTTFAEQYEASINNSAGNKSPRLIKQGRANQAGVE